MREFGRCSDFGLNVQGWRKAARKAGRGFRRVDQRAEAFMRIWNSAVSCRAEEGTGESRGSAIHRRHLYAAEGGGRGGVRGGGGVLLKMLYNGFSGHRPDNLCAVSC